MDRGFDDRGRPLSTGLVHIIAGAIRRRLLQVFPAVLPRLLIDQDGTPVECFSPGFGSSRQPDRQSSCSGFWSMIQK